MKFLLILIIFASLPLHAEEQCIIDYEKLKFLVQKHGFNPDIKERDSELKREPEPFKSENCIVYGMIQSLASSVIKDFHELLPCGEKMPKARLEGKAWKEKSIIRASKECTEENIRANK